MPTILVDLLLQLFLPHFPESGKSTTKSFLLSPLGVYQSLCLAREEMLDINEDCWKDDVWGSQLLKNPQTELFFYYGAKDHWVADVERDLIIEKRGRGAKKWVEVVKDGYEEEDRVQVSRGGNVEEKIEEEDAWKPRMMICDEGIPHGFCICTLAPPSPLFHGDLKIIVYETNQIDSTLQDHGRQDGSMDC